MLRVDIYIRITSVVGFISFRIFDSFIYNNNPPHHPRQVHLLSPVIATRLIAAFIAALKAKLGAPNLALILVPLSRTGHHLATNLMSAL